MKAMMFLVVVLFAANCFGANALEQLNQRRVKAGLPAYKADARLQAAAEHADPSSIRGDATLLPHRKSFWVGYAGSFDPEGRRFNTCYAFSRSGGYAGAAAVVGPNGQTFYALDIRDTPSPIVQ